jgi:hypothetical protein
MGMGESQVDSRPIGDDLGSVQRIACRSSIGTHQSADPKLGPSEISRHHNRSVHKVTPSQLGENRSARRATRLARVTSTVDGRVRYSPRPTVMGGAGHSRNHLVQEAPGNALTPDWRGCDDESRAFRWTSFVAHALCQSVDHAPLAASLAASTIPPAVDVQTPSMEVKAASALSRAAIRNG